MSESVPFLSGTLFFYQQRIIRVISIMMLHSIREKAKGWFAWVIVILISVPFALWGIGSYITPDSNPAVAMVDQTKVSTYEFQNALQLEQQKLESQSKKIDEKFLKQTVLDRLINNHALLNHLYSQGYVTSRSSLNSQIINEQAFQDPKRGEFSEKIFTQSLQRMGLSFETFKKQLGDDLLIQQYTSGINKAVLINKMEINSIVALLKQKRDISYILIDSNKFSESSQPSDEEVNNYYQANKEKYEVPEKVKVAYIEVSRDKIAKTIDVTEDEIDALYTDNAAKYTQAEQRQASHILISFNKDDNDEVKNKAREEIDMLYKKLQDGEDFATLAKENSKDPGSARNGGDLGYFKKGDMVPEFEKVTYSLTKDEISEPFESPFGFHIIKLTAIKESQVKPLSTVKKQIIADIQYDRAEKIYYEKMELLQTIAYEQPDTLEPASSEIDIAISESPLVSKMGGKGIFANKKLLNTIFDEQVLESGNNSDLVEIGNDHVIVVRLNERIPASIKPLKDVKESISKTLATRNANNKALELANTLSTSVSEQADIKALLAENQLEIVDKGLVERNDMGTDQQILQKAFSMPRVNGKPKSLAFKMIGEQVAVVVVKQVENGSSDDEQFVQMVSNSLKQSRGSLYANMAIMQIRKNAKIEINQERLFNEEN
ncbi:MAG: SurA N-terminal domain-containing protein [Pseudomonadota bacterium]